MSLDLDAIKARAEAATKGPWRWRGNVDHECPSLVGHRGDVLALIRREREADDPATKSFETYVRETEVYDANLNDGNGGYRPWTEEEIADKVKDEWLEDEWGSPRTDERLFLFDPQKRLYKHARDLAVFEVCRSATDRKDSRVYRADIVGLRNANAIFMEHSRQDVDDLVAEVERQREEIMRLRDERDQLLLDLGEFDHADADREDPETGLALPAGVEGVSLGHRAEVTRCESRHRNYGKCYDIAGHSGDHYVVVGGTVGDEDGEPQDLTWVDAEASTVEPERTLTAVEDDTAKRTAQAVLTPDAESLPADDWLADLDEPQKATAKTDCTCGHWRIYHGDVFDVGTMQIGVGRCYQCSGCDAYHEPDPFAGEQGNCLAPVTDAERVSAAVDSKAAEAAGDGGVV